MSALIQWFYLLALALWVGAIFFFSFITTPTVFTNLPREIASQFLSALFPRYYFLGYVAGGILLVMTLLESILVRQLPWIRLLFIAIMLGSTLYAGMAIRPRVHDLKVQMKTMEEDAPLAREMKTRFDRWHRLSVILNLLVLGSGIFLIGIVAFRLRL